MYSDWAGTGKVDDNGWSLMDRTFLLIFISLLKQEIMIVTSHMNNHAPNGPKLNVIQTQIFSCSGETLPYAKGLSSKK